MFDTRFSWAVIFIALISCLFPLLPVLVDPLLVGTAVRSIENIQAVLLLGIAIFTLCYMRPWDMPNGQKQFWFWAACWWLLLFGRSISWGRDYFPEIPKIYFRGISVILIGSVVFMLFSPHLRQEIKHQFKRFSIPVWALLLAFSGLVISDSIEHLRLMHSLFLTDLHYQSFVEELYEFPLIIGLFLTTFPLMQQHMLQRQSLQVEQSARSGNLAPTSEVEV